MTYATGRKVGLLIVHAVLRHPTAAKLVGVAGSALIIKGIVSTITDIMDE